MNNSRGRIITVRPEKSVQTRQQLPKFEGISGATAGATALCLQLVIIPPGGQAVAHVHEGYETAIYIVKGRVETRFGEGLSQSDINEAGDFIFIPADLPHQPVNLSQTEEVVAVVARNDPNEQEHVMIYDPSQRS